MFDPESMSETAHYAGAVRPKATNVAITCGPTTGAGEVWLLQCNGPANCTLDLMNKGKAVGSVAVTG